MMLSVISVINFLEAAIVIKPGILQAYYCTIYTLDFIAPNLSWSDSEVLIAAVNLSLLSI